MLGRSPGCRIIDAASSLHKQEDLRRAHTSRLQWRDRGLGRRGI